MTRSQGSWEVMYGVRAVRRSGVVCLRCDFLFFALRFCVARRCSHAKADRNTGLCQGFLVDTFFFQTSVDSNRGL